MEEVLQTGLVSFGLSKGSVALVLRMPIVQRINASQRKRKRSKVRAELSVGFITGVQVTGLGEGHSLRKGRLPGECVNPKATVQGPG